MFENIGSFFKRIIKTEPKQLASKDAAKERLHLVLMQDRANVSADFLELMKQEIIDVIKKYIEIDEKSIDVRLTNQSNEDGTNGAPALYANIPIINIKNDMKVEKEKEIEKAKTEESTIEKKEEKDNSENEKNEVPEQKEENQKEDSVEEDTEKENKEEKEEIDDVPTFDELLKQSEEDNIEKDNEIVIQEEEKKEEIDNNQEKKKKKSKKKN